MNPTSIDHDRAVLDQPLRRIMELSELHEDDLVLIVANCAPESELDASYWYSGVSTVESSRVESGLHYKGPIWTVRLKSDPENHIYGDVMDPKEPANGVFASGGYWTTQLYLLLSAKEIKEKQEIKDDPSN